MMTQMMLISLSDPSGHDMMLRQHQFVIDSVKVKVENDSSHTQWRYPKCLVKTLVINLKCVKCVLMMLL